MDEQHLQNIAEACPIEDAAAGTVLFRQGDPGSFAYLLVSGELSVDVDTPHGDVTLAVLTAPDMVGEISVFARSPRTATVRTRSAVQLLRLDRDVVRGLLIDHPDAILTIIGALGNRLQGMNGAIATLTQDGLAFPDAGRDVSCPLCCLLRNGSTQKQRGLKQQPERHQMDPSGERFSSASADLGTLVALLKTHDIFASMDEQHLQNIAEACPIEDAAAGTVLFRQGDPGSFAYLLVSGELSVDVDTPHGDVTLAVLTAPDMVGEISVFARSPRTATVRTRSAVQLLRLDRDVVRGLLIDHPDAILTIIGALGNRLQGMNGAIATLTQ
ncbi:CRP-like cAMP-activated global transcriptional regulator (cAMP receptor protein) (CRP) (cAMP regulatory protein), partial [Durusdinium trenchii]